ncbi:MAG: hypothetical protein K0S07_1232 [Chlamydiales bacterium]|jgi:hypothetical protein|nr:hypothetical protein [Chlamydiales bacterium]
MDINRLSSLKIEMSAGGELSNRSLSSQQESTARVAQKMLSSPTGSTWQAVRLAKNSPRSQASTYVSIGRPSLASATISRKSIPSVPLELHEAQEKSQTALSSLPTMTSHFIKARNEEIALEAKKEAILEDRTRQGLVTYSEQFTKAGFQALEAAYRALDGKIPDEAKGALDESFANAQLNFGRLEKTLSHRQAFNLLPDEVLQHLSEESPEGDAARAQLETAMRQPVIGGKENAEMLEKAAAEAELLDVECQSLIFAFLEKAVSNLSESGQADLRPFIDGLKKEVPNYMGNARANQLHAQAEWHEKASFTMNIKASDQSDVSFSSTYQANGQPYSSALPRNRLKEETCPANFFATELEGASKEVLFSSSRSATPTEFGLDNPEQRAQSTQQNVKIILDRQLQKAVQESFDKGEPIGETFVLKTQMLLLMTPDIARDMGSKLMPKRVNRADNERLLSEETIAANKHWNGQTDRVKVTIMVDGKAVEMEIQVTYQTSTFNIPCNRTQEKLSGSILKQAVAHSATDRSNQEALQAMAEQKESRMQSLRAETDRYASLPGSASLISEFKSLMSKKEEARKALSQAGNETQEKKALAEWQLLSKEVKALLDKNSGLPKELLSALKTQHLIEDAFADVKEMIDKKVYNNLKIVDKSRYALGARILFLGNLLETSQHFTCRSGKDRTGLQDSEGKLLAAEVAAEGRFLSFHESKYMDSHDINRILVTTQSGNDVHNTKANVGMRWYNIKGARLNSDRYGLQEVYSQLLSASKVFKRPKVGKTPLLGDNSPMTVNRQRREEARLASLAASIQSGRSQMRRQQSL